MITVLHITRASVFLILVSFASTALSTTVTSVTGTAPINGAWTFPGCSFDPGEYDDRDYQEFLVYGENTVEVKIVQYASDNGNCDGGITNILTEEIVGYSIEGEVVILGWLGEDSNGDEAIVPPPSRQDGTGPLPEAPDDPPFLASIEILEVDGNAEEGCVYIDDTSLTWYMYRCAGEDDAPIPFLDTNEPLIKTELPIGVIPIPAGIWLFGTALLGFVGFSRRRKLA